ncbi:hypothetical protein B0T22DRAFT_473830 [Podospora appendiculata]|uniref:Secreted protein n=1 Tax=Podospora appendiculata TaxID=314037 RepID=A0AAE0WZ01_9PEZI|nr:hypothetical protein B0T22DRAFT_473830 [Podospora appendiculata]
MYVVMILGGLGLGLGLRASTPAMIAACSFSTAIVPSIRSLHCGSRSWSKRRLADSCCADLEPTCVVGSPW